MTTRRQVAAYTFIGTGCLFASVARIRDDGLSVIDGLGAAIGIYLLVWVALEVRERTTAR